MEKDILTIKMYKFKDLMQFILPEVVVGIIVAIILLMFPDIIGFASTYLFNDNMKWDDYLKLLGLPSTILVLTYNFGDKILNPEDAINRKKLKQWTGYWMLKNRVYYSIIVSFLVLCGSIICWYYTLNVNIEKGTIVLLCLWSISLTSFSTVALAKLAIKDILY
ncbi:MAG: hypothetical protein V2A75_07590 [Pseudomonadota bacterium]